MSNQPKALQLADALELDPMPMGWCDEAAAELRRLYQLCMDQQGEIYALKMARSMEQKTAALVAAAEREACAKVCDGKVEAEYATGKVDHNEMAWAQSCAIEIRARGDR